MIILFNLNHIQFKRYFFIELREILINTKTILIYVHSINFILILSMEKWIYILHGTIFVSYRGGIQIIGGVQPLYSNRNNDSIFSGPEDSIQKPWLLSSSLCLTVYQYACCCCWLYICCHQRGEGDHYQCYSK